MNVCGAIKEHFWTSQWLKAALTISKLKDFHLYDFNMVDHTNTKSKQTNKKNPPLKAVLQLHAKVQCGQLELLSLTVSIL